MTPALVFYDILKKNFNLYISTDSRGLHYIDNKNYNLIVIETPQILKNLIFLPIKIFSILLQIFKSLIFLKRSKIEIILSTGGYAPVPICLAAIILGLKIYIYEPNQVIGRSNKFFLKFCKKVFCHNKKIINFPNKFKKKIFIISPLVRKNFFKIRKKKNKKFCILVIGGSQGAKIFDSYLHKIFKKLKNKISLKIIHQTKKNNIKNLKDFYKKNNIDNIVFDYNKNLVNLINNSDFCITRAGASTLAELLILKIPFLAIPLPSAKDNHQYENARFYKNMGCCWTFNENNLNEIKIYKFLKKIIFNKKDFMHKKKSMFKFNKKINLQIQNKKIHRILNEN